MACALRYVLISYEMAFVSLCICKYILWVVKCIRFVVNTHGEVIGVLSIRDIAKELIKMERRQQGVAAAAAHSSN